ncbi:MAG: C69 family dipeptidase, partial [Candidatus Aminicenantes bacterium]|nr:C69 family dipeptidase [Candidatus Aminicenantes bacterium]
MRFKKILPIGVLLLAALVLIRFSVFNKPEGKELESYLTVPLSDGCTVIMVGKDASTDGSVMTTHTCDCGLCDWTWRYIPAADHEPGSMRKIYHINQFRSWPPSVGLKWDRYKDDFTGLELPEVPHTFAY